MRGIPNFDPRDGALDLARRALADARIVMQGAPVDTPCPPCPLSIDDARRAVTATGRAFDIDEGLLLGEGRKRAESQARFGLWLLLRERRRAPVKALGRRFERAHSAIVHGVQVARELREQDPTFREKFERALSLFGGEQAAA